MQHFDYCDALLSDLSSELSVKLQRAQNMCVRYVCNIRRYDHISPSFASLSWLRLKDRRTLHSLSLLFRILHTSTSNYLSSRFSYLYSNHDSKQASLVYRSSTRVCVRICVSIRRPEFECSGPQLEGPEFECSGPQLEGPEFEYSELSLKTIEEFSTLFHEKMLVQTLVMPHFDYCDILFTDLSVTSAQRLQRVLNMCVRFVCNIRRADHLYICFRHSHWSTDLMSDTVDSPKFDRTELKVLNNKENRKHRLLPPPRLEFDDTGVKHKSLY
ncbi:hypothetical protein ANN_27246 [Periplaneta americana]|uniref:Uncharacterized protein n=1 Tax=Periplaneta americana TaxID=6978 RepID=A0ABQ8RXH1_PERAM|nr:hypothetical protein ANN_27246 [Periplaneta americana]